ncbi:MAG: flippase [Deltaproteobacteria bacterium]|nr:flippase [Deltaproteobacteria bacterium]
MTSIKRKIQNFIYDKSFLEILTGSAWALSARVIATLLGVVTNIIIARCYGAEIIGIVAILNSFLALATIFTVLGTNTSILRLIPEHLIKYSPTSAFKIYRKTMYFVAGVSLITGSILFFGSGFIADSIFSKPHLQFYFGLSAMFIIFGSLNVLNTQAVRGVRLIRVFAFLQLLPSLCRLIILVPITLFFFQQDNPIYATFAAITVSALAGTWIMNRAFKQKSGPNDSLHAMSLKEILTISIPMLMTSTMTFVIGQTGVIMLGIFRSEAEVGYYAIAVSIASLTVFVLKAVNSMAGPKFSELYHSDKLDELFHVAKKSAKLIFWITVPILFFLIFFGKQLLSQIYGPDFSVAYWAMVLLILGQFINSISGATGLFMNMTGNQNMFRNFVFIATLINIGLNILLTPTYGLYGAATAGMVSLMVWNIATLCYIKLRYGKTTGYFPILA